LEGLKKGGREPVSTGRGLLNKERFSARIPRTGFESGREGELEKSRLKGLSTMAFDCFKGYLFKTKELEDAYCYIQKETSQTIHKFSSER